MYIKPIISKINKDRKGKKLLIIFDIILITILYFFINQLFKKDYNILTSSNNNFIKTQNYNMIKNTIIKTNLTIHIISIISYLFYILVKKYLLYNQTFYDMRNNDSLIKSLLINNYVLIFVIILNILIYIPEFNTNINLQKSILDDENNIEQKSILDNEQFRDLKKKDNKQKKELTYHDVRRLYKQKLDNLQTIKTDKIIESEQQTEAQLKYLNENIEDQTNYLSKNYENDFIPANEYSNINNPLIYSKQYVKDMKLKPTSIFDINNPGEKRNKELLNILNYDTKKGVRQTLECTGVIKNKKKTDKTKSNKLNNANEQHKILEDIMNAEIYDNDTEFYKYETYGKNLNYAHLSKEEKEELNKNNKKQIRTAIDNLTRETNNYNTHNNFEIIKNNAIINHKKFVNRKNYGK